MVGKHADAYENAQIKYKMFIYKLNMFIDDRYTFVGLFKDQPTFYAELRCALDAILETSDFNVIVCSDGVVVESETPLDMLEGHIFRIVVNDVTLEFRAANRHWIY